MMLKRASTFGLLPLDQKITPQSMNVDDQISRTTKPNLLIFGQIGADNIVANLQIIKWSPLDLHFY